MANKTKKLWFRAKWFGYGWYPSSWEGWLVLLIWAVIFVSNMMMLDHEAGKNLFFIFIATALLIYICYKTGEKPRWRWGRNS